jgi:mannose-6-phosphate isomerase-like protein (cupin superfamily)
MMIKEAKPRNPEVGDSVKKEAELMKRGADPVLGGSFRQTEPNRMSPFETEQKERHAIFVPAGKDRFGQCRSVLGGLSIDFKVTGQDTNGGLFLLQHTDHHKGGPPRHYHHEQEEFFYVLKGTYVLVVDNQRYQLEPGDSVLAPRKVPHVWAHVGEGEGKLIIAFQPAGMMEAFLNELSQIKGVQPPERMQGLFRAHGMELVGPPLSVT